jgi:cytochrome c oxidase subunit I
MVARLNTASVETSPAARRELKHWAGLAVLALALAGLFALLLAVSRIPGSENVIAWPATFFRKGLVIHVVFAFVVWFLAVFAALCLLMVDALGGGRARAAFLGRLAVLLATGGFILLLIPALLDRGTPTLNNYIPIITDPMYYTGLGVLAAGLLMAVLRLWASAAGGIAWTRPPAVAIIGASVLFVLALTCAALAWDALDGRTPDHAYNEDLTWGVGHVLQFVNAALLIGAWQMLAQATVGRNSLPPALFQAAIALLVAGGTVGPILYFAYEPFSAAHRDAFTLLQYAMAPSTTVAAIGLGAAILARRREAPLPWDDPGFLCLILSPLVFLVGGFLGLFVDGTDTRTPGHYHGVIAGVMLAFFGLFYRLILPRLGHDVGRGRAVRAQVWLFGVGQTLASIGLFWAGGAGAARKTAGAAQGLEGIAQIGGMALNGVGGVIAVAGGLMFIWTTGRAVVHKGPHNSRGGA